MPSSHLILYRLLLLLPPVPPSIRVFSNESTLRMRWPKYWSFTLRTVFPMNNQDWFPSEWTGWISLQSKGLTRVFSSNTVQKHQDFSAQLSSQPNFHIHTWPMEYYLAIKKNAFEPVLMRWMKLEPIIQSKVSQKEKHQYSILTHIYGI